MAYSEGFFSGLHLFTNLVQAVRLEAVAGAGQQEGGGGADG